MRFVYWSMSTFFMFAASLLAVSIITPGPTETQVMSFMQGMMSAMHTGLMGASMDGAELYFGLLQQSARLSLLMLVLGIAVGLPLRMWRKHD